MNQEFVLGKLSTLMKWEESRDREEFAWLRLMSRMKYDGYQDFLAGIRFIESLASWLQQFKQNERETAFQFLKKNLVFVSPGEIRHLVELFYSDTVQPRLVRKVAEILNIPKYRVWSDPEATALYDRLLRKTLFVELSDGARIDIFRRANAGVISNDQVVTAPRIIEAKWDDMLEDLRAALHATEERFSFVFLVDDFTASGTTLLRTEEKDGSVEWKGKLPRFFEDASAVINSHFEDDWTLCVHHYISSQQADNTIRQRNEQVKREKDDGQWFAQVEFSYGMLLPEEMRISSHTHPDFAQLVNDYYDDVIETKHMKLGGDDARFGFGNCGLPLILEHNTPNNSLAILWAETPGGDGKHAMRPLFRRRQRHV